MNLVKTISNDEEILIKGIPKNEYMKNYMKNYRNRDYVREKKEARHKQHREKKIIERVAANQKRQKEKQDAESINIIDLTRLDMKNRITLGRPTCNLLGAVPADEIAIIKDEKHIRLIKLSNLKIEYK